MQTLKIPKKYAKMHNIFNNNEYTLVSIYGLTEEEKMALRRDKAIKTLKNILKKYPHQKSNIINSILL